MKYRSGDFFKLNELTRQKMLTTFMLLLCIYYEPFIMYFYHELSITRMKRFVGLRRLRRNDNRGTQSGKFKPVVLT